MRIVLVLLTVLLTLLSSLLLDYAADNLDKYLLITAMIIVLVVVINGLKFLLWGRIHRRYEVNRSYPITSVFFPLIYVIALIQGESTVELSKIIGVILIFFGLIAFEYNTNRA